LKVEAQGRPQRPGSKWSRLLPVQFRKRYPRIKLKPERLITDEGDLFCSGGYSAAIDLSLYLVEKYCGHEVALQSSKSLIADSNRMSQAPYAVFQYRKDHGDDRILAIQEWIEKNYSKAFNYNELAEAMRIPLT
jgi:transcriptional regulator GlxA family with amidase domain